MSATHWDSEDLTVAASTNDPMPISVVQKYWGQPKDAWSQSLFDFLMANAADRLDPHHFSDLKKSWERQ